MRRIVASGFGVGLIPHRLWGKDDGAGTFGTALAALISLATRDAWVSLQLLLVVVAVALSLWSAIPFAVGGADPGWVVVDEIAGTVLALVLLGGFPWVVALVVFRIADITKWPPGVRSAEALPGALGITADDLVAGLYGLAAGALLTLIF